MLQSENGQFVKLKNHMNPEKEYIIGDYGTSKIGRECVLVRTGRPHSEESNKYAMLLLLDLVCSTSLLYLSTVIAEIHVSESISPVQGPCQSISTPCPVTYKPSHVKAMKAAFSIVELSCIGVLVATFRSSRSRCLEDFEEGGLDEIDSHTNAYYQGWSIKHLSVSVIIAGVLTFSNWNIVENYHEYHNDKKITLTQTEVDICTILVTIFFMCMFMMSFSPILECQIKWAWNNSVEIPTMISSFWSWCVRQYKSQKNVLPGKVWRWLKGISKRFGSSKRKEEPQELIRYSPLGNQVQRRNRNDERG